MKKQKKKVHKKFQTKGSKLLTPRVSPKKFVEDTNISGLLRVLDKPNVIAFHPAAHFQTLNPNPTDYGRNENGRT